MGFPRISIFSKKSYLDKALNLRSKGIDNAAYCAVAHSGYRPNNPADVPTTGNKTVAQIDSGYQAPVYLPDGFIFVLIHLFFPSIIGTLTSKIT